MPLGEWTTLNPIVSWPTTQPSTRSHAAHVPAVEVWPSHHPITGKITGHDLTSSLHHTQCCNSRSIQSSGRHAVLQVATQPVCLHPACSPDHMQHCNPWLDHPTWLHAVQRVHMQCCESRPDQSHCSLRLDHLYHTPSVSTLSSLPVSQPPFMCFTSSGTYLPVCFPLFRFPSPLCYSPGTHMPVSYSWTPLLD